MVRLKFKVVVVAGGLLLPVCCFARPGLGRFRSRKSAVSPVVHRQSQPFSFKPWSKQAAQHATNN